MPADDVALEALALRLDRAAADFYRSVGPETALAFHAAKSALLAAVARAPGGRWGRGTTCYQATPAGLLIWSAPDRGAPPPPRRKRLARQKTVLFSGPGVLPRPGRSLYPPQGRRRTA